MVCALLNAKFFFNSHGTAFPEEFPPRGRNPEGVPISEEVKKDFFPVPHNISFRKRTSNKWRLKRVKQSIFFILFLRYSDILQINGVRWAFNYGGIFHLTTGAKPWACRVKFPCIHNIKKCSLELSHLDGTVTGAVNSGKTPFWVSMVSLPPSGNAS